MATKVPFILETWKHPQFLFNLSFQYSNPPPLQFPSALRLKYLFMDPKYIPFVVFDERDVPSVIPSGIKVQTSKLTCTRSQAPRLVLEPKGISSTYGPVIEADPPYMSVTLPYNIAFDIGRLRQNNDTDNTAIVFRFHPWRHVFDGAQLILLHVTEHGLEKVEVPPLNQYMSEKDNVVLGERGRGYGDWYYFEQLDVDERTYERATHTLKSNYQQMLVPGEKYELFWPGAEIDMWGWGLRDDYMTKEVKCNSIRREDEKLPPLILPATKIASFTAKAEDEPWPDRQEIESKRGFEKANEEEWQWRYEQEFIRNPPPSPPPLEESERV